MTAKAAFRNILVCTTVIVLGTYIAFRNYWTHSDLKYFVVLSWFAIGFGSLHLGINITRVLFFKMPDFGFSELADRKKYNALKKQTGSRKMLLINISYLSLFFSFFLETGYLFFRTVNRHEHDQLSRYGTVQTVRIESIHYRGKGGPRAFFHIDWDGKTYEEELPAKGHVAGERVAVVFSSQDPDIVEWENDWLDEKWEGDK